MAMLAYRQGLIDAFQFECQTYVEYNANVQNLTEEQFARLTDYTLLGEAMDAAGKGFQIQIIGTGVETAVMVSGHMVKGPVVWRLPADPEGSVFFSSTVDIAFAGSLFSSDAPYEVMLGDGLLKGIRNPEKLIGEKVLLYGSEFTVCGILHSSDNIEANMYARSNLTSLMLRFRIPVSTPHDPADLIQVMNEKFGVTGIAELRVSEAYAEATLRESDGMTLLAFAGFAFCLLNSLGIINSVLFDCRRKIYIKMTAGAKRSEVFLEQMVFWSVLLTAASLLAFLASYGVKAYMAMYFVHPLSIGWQTALSLPLMGFGMAVLISFYSVRRIARWLA
jgi:hypothetical protein